MQGSLVAISSHKDLFRTSCKVAVIAARPLVGGVDQNPPQVDIFWGNHNEVVFDPDERKKSHHLVQFYADMLQNIS
jgi:helicase required for RNAi-mediated heterochromatin assembly 1